MEYTLPRFLRGFQLPIVGANLRGDRGEFFTPRNVCRMAVESLFHMLVDNLDKESSSTAKNRPSKQKKGK